MSVRIAYYYSADRAGRPVSAQENASRRSGKVTQRGHARRYGQAYIGCLTTDSKIEKMLIHRGVDEEQSICMMINFLRKFLVLQPFTRNCLLDICTLLHFIRPTGQTTVYISYTRSTLYTRRAAARVRSLPLHVSFILSPSPTRLSPPSISSVRGMNH